MNVIANCYSSYQCISIKSVVRFFVLGGCFVCFTFFSIICRYRTPSLFKTKKYLPCPLRGLLIKKKLGFSRNISYLLLSYLIFSSGGSLYQQPLQKQRRVL